MNIWVKKLSFLYSVYASHFDSILYAPRSNQLVSFNFNSEDNTPLCCRLNPIGGCVFFLNQPVPDPSRVDRHSSVKRTVMFVFKYFLSQTFPFCIFEPQRQSNIMLHAFYNMAKTSSSWLFGPVSSVNLFKYSFPAPGLCFWQCTYFDTSRCVINRDLSWSDLRLHLSRSSKYFFTFLWYLLSIFVISRVCIAFPNKCDDRIRVSLRSITSTTHNLIDLQRFPNNVTFSEWKTVIKMASVCLSMRRIQ